VALRRDVTLPAGVDLHARPAGLVVRTAATLPTPVTLIAGERRADARSILQVVALGATAGSAITLEACGDQASAALDALAGLLEALA
jgi:phosphotransferase system HPr (HPr) family protein